MRLRAASCACAVAARPSAVERGVQGDGGRRGCGCLARVGVTDIMPGIVELPTLEELKVQEVRLVWRTGKRGHRAESFPGLAQSCFDSAGPGLRSPYSGPPTPYPINTYTGHPRMPLFSSGNRPTPARSGSRTLSPPP